MSDRFVVWVVEPEGDRHARTFHEVAQGIRVAFAELGIEASLLYGAKMPDPDSGRLVVFNAHHLVNEVLPPDTIIFNAEQIRTAVTNDAWTRYLGRLRSYQVWDYSAVNVERLRQLDVKRIAHCRVGYYAALSKITPVQEDIDVLFYGSLNDRRMHILTELQNRDISVRHVFGVYGAPRDAFIARSKIVLNVHFFSNPIFEIFRVSHLLANKKCVLTEDGGVDEELERVAEASCARVRYYELVDKCVSLVRDDAARKYLADEGFRIFSKIRQVDEVRRALEASR